MVIRKKISYKKLPHVTNSLFLIGIIFFVGGLVYGSPLNREIFSANRDKLLMLLKIELITIGLLLSILGFLVSKKKIDLSRIKHLFLLSIPFLLYLGFGFWHLWVTDDAFITFRAVRNFLSGTGPIFNIGERVEVYSHPLWFGILAFWDFLTSEIELGAAWLGLLFSVLGLFLGQWGTVKLLNRNKDIQLPFFIPLASLTIVALRPFWEYASSGLETGFGFFWLGTAFFLFAQGFAEKGLWRKISVLIWCSLGPLIRPDFIIFSLGLILLFFAIHPPKSVGSFLSFVIAGAFMPVGYQLFRMGYFASLYPNPALAKSALSSYWSQGIIYLKDFILPYKLYIPLTIIGILFFFQALETIKKHQTQKLIITSAFTGLGLLYAFFIIRGGGDFMHGRFLLSSVFAIHLPLSCIALSKNRFYRCLEILSIIVMIIWTVWCIGWGRISYRAIGPHGIANEHLFYKKESGQSNPITLTDYGIKSPNKSEWITSAHKIAKKGISYKRILPNFRGRTSMAAGPSFYLYPSGGLADPIASRFLLQRRGRPGHEKFMPETWKLARFTDPINKKNTFELLTNSQAFIDVNSLIAKKTLECSPILNLLEGIQTPLTPRRFFQNVWLAWRTRNLKIPKDPLKALSEFCHPIPCWIQPLLLLEPNQKILTLRKNSDPSESRYKRSFFNPRCHWQYDKFVFEFKPWPTQSPFTVQLYIEGYEGEIYCLSYRFLSDHSEKYSFTTHGSHATFFLTSINQTDNWYCLDRDIGKELQRTFGRQACFLCIRRIILKGNTKYLLVKKLYFYKNNE